MKGSITALLKSSVPYSKHFKLSVNRPNYGFARGITSYITAYINLDQKGAEELNWCKWKDAEIN